MTSTSLVQPAARSGSRRTRRTYGRKLASISFGKPRVKHKKLPDFTRSLATLLEAGLPIVRSLKTLEEQARDPLEKQLVRGLINSVESGSTLSDAMREYGSTFDRLFVNMVRAGEASGSLEGVLNQLATYLEKSATLKGKVKAALTYPLVVLSIAVVITTGLMVFIVPKFATMFTEMFGNEPLPGITRMVIAISNVLLHHAWQAILGGIVAVVAFKLIKRTTAGAYMTDYMLLNMPPLSDLFVKLYAARFCSTLSTLIGSGVSVLQALQITRDTCANAVVARAVQVAHDSVKEGESLSGPLASTRVFPVMVVSMIQVGEETGALPEMLARISRNYEERVDRAVDALTSLIEPLMIVVLGGLVGTIVLAMFMPLMRIIELM